MQHAITEVLHDSLMVFTSFWFTEDEKVTLV